MQCDEFEIRVQDILDERGKPEQDALLREHAGNCAQCRNLLSSFAAAIEGLELCAVPSVSRDLSARVLAELQRPQVLRIPARRRRLMLATAAAVLLLAAPLAWWATHRSSPSVQIAHEPPAAVAPVVPADEPEDRLASALLALPSLSGMPVSAPGDGTSNRSQSRWREEVSDGLAPLTRSTAGAFDTLWQAIPGASEDTRS